MEAIGLVGALGEELLAGAADGAAWVEPGMAEAEVVVGAAEVLAAMGFSEAAIAADCCCLCGSGLSPLRLAKISATFLFSGVAPVEDVAAVVAAAVATRLLFPLLLLT